MVKGKRGRAPTKGSARTRSTMLSSEEGGTKTSPPRKETRTEKFGGKSARGADDVGSYEASVRVATFFYSDLSETDGARCDSGRDRGTFEGDRSTGVRLARDVATSAELFKTDETPVAVPVRGPSTPHRINMPIVPAEGDKTVEPVAGKPVGGTRGRRRLDSNRTVGERSVGSPLAVGTANRKLTDYYPVRRSVRRCKKAVLEEKQRDLEDKVLRQVEEGLRVERFAGKGRGIVTTRSFSKGEFVVEYIGELIDQTTAKRREAEYAQDRNTGCYMYYFQHRNHQYCVDATAETNKLGRLVNHCRNGNLVARVVDVDSVPHLVLTAKEDVPAGVEVTYDYGDRSREAVRNHPWLAL